MKRKKKSASRRHGEILSVDTYSLMGAPDDSLRMKSGIICVFMILLSAGTIASACAQSNQLSMTRGCFYGFKSVSIITVHHQYSVQSVVEKDVVASNVIANLLAICGQGDTGLQIATHNGVGLSLGLRGKDEAALLLAAILNIPFVLYDFDNKDVRETKIANLVRNAGGTNGKLQSQAGSRAPDDSQIIRPLPDMLGQKQPLRK